MPYLIDGDNLLGTWPGRRRSDAERRQLSLELGRIAARESKRIVTVFDGVAPPAASFGAEVIFSGAGRTADAEILAQLGRQTDARQWVVVTSDRSLGDQCRYLGARVERCDRFRRRLRSSAGESEKPERVEDVDYWLEQFGEDPD